MCQVLEVKDKYNTTIQRERERGERRYRTGSLWGGGKKEGESYQAG